MSDVGLSLISGEEIICFGVSIKKLIRHMLFA
jgi:hypothetical protein